MKKVGIGRMNEGYGCRMRKDKRLLKIVKYIVIRPAEVD